MSDIKTAKRLLREFVSEVVVAGEFNDGDIRPVGNYRPEDNYRRTDNYRAEDPKSYLGMTQPVKEPETGDEENGDLEGDEGAADGGQPKMGDKKNEPFNSPGPSTQQQPGGDPNKEPNAQEPAVKKPEWKNPLL